MTIILSHNTAVECWRSGLFDACPAPGNQPWGQRLAGVAEIERAAEQAARSRRKQHRTPKAFLGVPCSSAKQFKPLSADVAHAAAILGTFATRPIHTLVPTRETRNEPQGTRCHTCTKPLPHGSLIPIDDQLLVASPELAFLSMANQLPFHHLVKLGYELCGTYMLLPDGSAKYHRYAPATCRQALDGYLAKCESIKGVTAARRALKYVAAASGSPMETALAETLCLPCRYGGYGFPLPQMNALVNRQEEDKKLGRGRYYLCDLYWPDSRVCVEYDSDQEHTGAMRITHDAIRRNNLQNQGVCIITATRGQVLDPWGFDQLAHQIAKRIGFRIRPERGVSPFERNALLRSLIGHGAAALPAKAEHRKA